MSIPNPSYGLVVDHEYTLNVTDNTSALYRVGINSMEGHTEFDGLLIRVTKVYGTGTTQRIYIESADGISVTKDIAYGLKRYYWPPECFTLASVNIVNIVNRKNIFNLWPGMEGKSNV